MYHSTRSSNMKRIMWVARLVAVVAVIAPVVAGSAQAQTPEGTVITNVATVTFTDANSNSYTPVSASVSVTVGFTAGVDVIAGAATVSPASPSTADTLNFQVVNIGNGTDSVAVAQSISVSGIITVTGYRVGVTPHADLTALNSALSGP